MKKFIKIILVLCAVFLVLLAGALFALKKLLPPEKVKELVTQEVAKKFHREVSLGEVKIGIFSGVSVKDFALSEYSGFKNGTFVESKNFILKFQLIPLFRKKVVIDEVKLESPKIAIIQNPDGKTFNFSDLIALSTAPAKTVEKEEKPREDSPIALTVSKAKIADGKLSFIDKSARKIKITVSPINLSVTGTGLNKPMSVDLSFALDSILLGKGLKGDLKLKSIVDLPAERVKIETLEWAMNALVLNTKGEIQNFKEPQMDLSILIHAIHLEELAPFFTLPKEAVLSGSPELSIRLKGGLKNLSNSITLNLTKSKVIYGGLFEKSEGTPFSVTLNSELKDRKDLFLQSLNVELAALKTEIKGEVKNLSADPILKLDISVMPFELKEIVNLGKLASPYNLSGQAGLQAKVEGPIKFLKVRGGLKLENCTARYEKYNLESLSGKIDFTENSVNISELKGKLGAAGKSGSDFQVRTSVQNFLRPEITLNAHFSTVDLDMLLPEKKKSETKKESVKKEGEEKPAPYKGPEIKAEGNVTIDKIIHSKFEGQKAALSWKLSGITPVLDRLNGTAELEMKDGKIQNVPLLAAVAPFLRLDPNSFAYSKIGGHWNIMQGTAKTEDFEILSPSADLFLKGSLYLPSKKPDFSLTAKLPKGSIGGTLGEFSSDAQGRPTFVFKIKNDWKPSLDASQIQKKVVEKATEEIKKKAVETLESEGRKLLEGIFKR